MSEKLPGSDPSIEEENLRILAALRASYAQAQQNETFQPTPLPGVTAFPHGEELGFAMTHRTATGEEATNYFTADEMRTFLEGFHPDNGAFDSILDGLV